MQAAEQLAATPAARQVFAELFVIHPGSRSSLQCVTEASSATRAVVCDFCSPAAQQAIRKISLSWLMTKNKQFELNAFRQHGSQSGLI